MSIYSTILEQVVDRIEALGLSGTPLVQRRKRFIALEDEGNLITVSPAGDQEISDADSQGTENVVIMRYGVLIGIVLPNGGGQLNGTSEDLMLSYRQDIRRNLYRPDAVAPSEPVVGVSIDMQPPFDRSGLDRDNINASAIMVMYDVMEPRYDE